MNRRTIVIGVIATIAICLQNGPAPLAVGWGLIHGAGPVALLALVPLAGCLFLLWGSALFLNRRAPRGMPILFGLLAAAILFLNEALLPATPLAAWRTQRAIEAVEVRNIRDELVLSARGNPIGIRLTFEAIFPRNGDYVIAGAWQSVDERPYALQFNHSFGVRAWARPRPPRSTRNRATITIFAKASSTPSEKCSCRTSCLMTTERASRV
jgi:hypothetical protein